MRRPIPASEEGYVLLIAIFFIALLVLSLAVAAPRIAKSIQRDREVETFHRGMQYRRAIQLYYRKFHAYPPNIDALVNTNNIHFLRKRYKDPMTGQDDWKPILFGHNKTPTAMGFFGQPLAGGASTLAGIGPSGGGLAGTSITGGSSFGGSSIFGSSDSGSSQTSSTGATGSGSSGATTGTDTSGGSGTSSDTTFGASSSSGSSSTTSSAFGPSGQTFGGAGIIGFEPGVEKASILVYKKKNHYNEWEFTYDPISDMKMRGGGNTGAIGQPASSTSTPVGTSSFGSSSSGSSSFGNSNLTPAPMPPETSAPQ